MNRSICGQMEKVANTGGQSGLCLYRPAAGAASPGWTLSRLRIASDARALRPPSSYGYLLRSALAALQPRLY